MKAPTKSRDGNYRITKRIEFRVDLNYLRFIVGRAFQDFNDISGVDAKTIIKRYIKSKSDLDYHVNNNLKDYGFEGHGDDYGMVLCLLGFDGWRDDGKVKTYCAVVVDELIAKYYPEFFIGVNYD